MAKTLKTRRQNGASMVEFSLVIGLLLICIGILLEAARYMAIQGVLIQGAQRGALTAARMQGLQYEMEDADYVQFQQARAQAVIDALQLPLGTLISNIDSSTGVRLLPSKVFETPPDDGSAAPAPQSVGAIVLRPGEFYSREEDNTLVNHPTLCNPAVTCQPGIPFRDRNMKMAQLFEENRHPIAVILRARVKPLIPFLNDFYIEGMAMEYRADFKRGAFLRPLPTALPTLTRTPTPTVTFTPNPNYSPTPTFSPTPTLVPTRTATPTATFFPCNCSDAQQEACLLRNRCAVCPNFVNECACSTTSSICRSGGG